MASRSKPYFLSILSGLLLALSFPKFNVSFLAWAALVPLFYALEDSKGRRAFFLSFVSGWTSFVVILYWLVPTFRAAQVPALLGAFSVALLAAYLALYFGLFGWAAASLFKTLRLSLVIPALAAGWTACEFLRTHVYTGFPWALLGYSQWRHPALIQTAEWTGVYGVSFLVLAANAFLYLRLRKKDFPFYNVLWVLLPLGFSLWTYRSQTNALPEAAPFQAAVLQGNIDQYKKWDKDYVEEVLGIYKSLSLSAANASPKPDVILWPETAAPGWVPNEPDLAAWIRERTRETSTYHLIGAVTRDGTLNYNSAFLFTPAGNVESRYDKIHLVPFGEFVPFQGFLGRWVSVLNELGGFEAGERAKTLPAPAGAVGATICYESVFPDVCRRQCLAGAVWLANLTNDGWYLDTAAPEQHFSMNVFRAVENRRTLVRATNTGISGVILPTGDLDARTGLNERTVLIRPVQPRTRLTFYTKRGDVFAWLCALAALAAVIRFKLKTKETLP